MPPSNQIDAVYPWLRAGGARACPEPVWHGLVRVRERDALLAPQVLHLDETTVQVLKEPGWGLSVMPRSAAKDSLVDPPGTLMLSRATSMK